MPSIASLAALQRVADEFPVTRMDLLIEPAARAAVRASVQEAGLLLLGEVHGVRENPLLAMFDGTADAGWDWSRHDAAMAARVLADAAAGTLVVAGNAHTPVRRTRLGVPMGAVLAQDRPGVREIRVRYGRGHFYNSTPRRIRRRLRPWRHRARLHLRGGTLLLDLPAATEAVVPQRPLPGPWRITDGPGS